MEHDVPKAAREPVIPLAVMRVTKEIEQVDALCAMLEKRLVSVSTPSGPEVAREAEKRPSCGVPLGLQLDCIKERLEMISRRLRNQIDRIELSGA